MVLYDQDPDITRWGLHLLLPDAAADACSATHHHTPATATTPHSAEIKVEHVAASDAVDNDEIIAQTLQEELSQIALAEASGAPSADDNHSAVLTQQWFRPRTIHVASGSYFHSSIPCSRIHLLLIFLVTIFTAFSIFTAS